MLPSTSNAHNESHSTPFADYSNSRTIPDDRSAYSLATVYGMSSPTPTDRTSLLSANSNSSDQGYGATGPSQPSSRRLLWNASLKMGAIFLVSTILLGGTLWLALPTLEEQDRPMLKIPKSFVELQALNTLLKKYRDIYPYRIVICYVITYFLLQELATSASRCVAMPPCFLMLPGLRIYKCYKAQPEYPTSWVIHVVRMLSVLVALVVRRLLRHFRGASKRSRMLPCKPSHYRALCTSPSSEVPSGAFLAPFPSHAPAGVLCRTASLA
ncbi:hypothetical protein NUW54_g12957 [Trametes sanguinea]|uniref:Uncharacterized protein n=1 Tax=Trametes sanguinea TaxID=158606 RepID=A0ACC1MR22_9APHY|nr:hypothetical protein NUW54_g12957 [Trametes sanguinea]